MGLIHRRTAPAMNTMFVFAEYATEHGARKRDPGQLLRCGLGHAAMAPPYEPWTIIAEHQEGSSGHDAIRPVPFHISLGELDRWRFDPPPDFRDPSVAYFFLGVHPERGWECSIFVCMCDGKPRYHFQMGREQRLSDAREMHREHVERGHQDP